MSPPGRPANADGSEVVPEIRHAVTSLRPLAGRLEPARRCEPTHRAQITYEER